MNIVVPMAGRGSRFANAGYDRPKPLIPIDDRPMIEWVIDNISPQREHRFIFLCLKEHLETYPEVEGTLRRLCPSCEIVEVNEVTEGAACTVLLAKDFIDNDAGLMIANSDQFVDCEIDGYLEAMQENDGLIMTFEADDPKWSFCRLNEEGYVTEVVEKEVISNEATVGIYNFKHGKDFVSGAEEMMKRGLKVNGEYYVAPVYNLMIEGGAKVIPYRIEAMYGLGTPEDYKAFKQTEAFRKNLAPNMLVEGLEGA